MKLEYIRKEINKVEFFVNSQTGESGVSISGLGKLSGVSQQGISKLLDSLTTSAPSQWLEPLIGKNLTLTTNYSNTDSKSRNVTIVKSEVCALIITHYAFKGRLKAQLALVKFSAGAERCAIAQFGIDRWIKDVVDYKDRNSGLPIQVQTAVHCKQIYENVEEFSPRVAQLLVDSLVNQNLSLTLPSGERLLGVMEIAAEMNYKIPNKLRSSLGRYVARHCANYAKVEQRMVNGLMCDCKLYPANNSFVKGAITEYVRGKGLTD